MKKWFILALVVIVVGILTPQLIAFTFNHVDPWIGTIAVPVVIVSFIYGIYLIINKNK